MSTSVDLLGTTEAWAPAPVKPLDEAEWQAWVAKGRARERRRNAARVKAMKWVSIAVLLAGAGLWSHLAPYDIVLRFILAAAAIVVMYEAFHARNYAFAVVFGTLALLYNPVAPAFTFSGEWQRALVVASAVPFVVSLAWPKKQGLNTMTKLQKTISKSALPLLLSLGVMPAAILTGALSGYRNFQLGTDLTTVARQIGANPSQAKVIHSRPALIQELEWRPQPLGSTSRTEPAKQVVFSFYDGELFRITVDYDRYETEGMTADDFVESISKAYGLSTKPTAPAKVAPGTYSDQQEILAQWQDPQYRFDLVRFSYGPTFRLVGVLKRLEAPAEAATVEAKRLDDQEAPQRDAARIASEEEAVKAKLEKARLVNKPNFRP